MEGDARRGWTSIRIRPGRREPGNIWETLVRDYTKLRQERNVYRKRSPIYKASHIGAACQNGRYTCRPMRINLRIRWMIPYPVGVSDISPAIHRWVTNFSKKLSPVRTTERRNIRRFSRPYGTEICYGKPIPSSRTTGLISYVLTDKEHRVLG